MNKILFQPAIEDRYTVLESNAVAALAYVSRSKEIRYLYAPTPIFNKDGTLEKVIGNASNDQRQFRPISLCDGVPDFATHIAKSSYIWDQAPIGNKPLRDEELKDTPWQERAAKNTEYKHSFFPCVAVIPFGTFPISGNPDGQGVIEFFETLDKGAQEWKKAMTAALYN
ncbi:MAG: hypothetical protein GY818_07625, partial [Planctomycetaceae bacterium]|nr:hypothetical protein [Planctomycetaceae bacterium]